MIDPPPPPDDTRRGDWSGPPPGRFGAPLRGLASRPDLLMALLGVLIVGLAVFMPRPDPVPPPASRESADAVLRTELPPTVAELIPDGLASDAAILAAASEAAGLATDPAMPLPPPPPPSAVLAAEGDAVLAAPAAPLPEPTAPGPARRKPGPVLIFDAGEGGTAPSEGDAPAPEVTLANPRGRTARTVAAPIAAGRGTLTQGTLIPAVLETAIDSGQPGGVRAMVSTDVRSADGRRVLVARSSRLVGQYRGDAGKGRAYVIWTRLERPDGSRVAIASAGGAARFLDSYASSPLVSQVGGAGGGTVRVRPGEPIRVIAARSFELAEARR